MRLVEFSPASVQAALPDIVQSIPPEWLRARRWFAGKSRDLAGIGSFDQALISEDPLVLLALLEARYADGASELYALPLLFGAAGGSPLMSLEGPAGPAAVSDALESPFYQRLCLQLIAEGAARGPLRFQPLTALRADAGDPKPLGVEQSNTSIRYGRTWILKNFRKVSFGENRDLEVGRFLTLEASFPHTPQVGGCISYTGRQAAILGVLQRFVENEGDGWTYVRSRLQPEDTPNPPDDIYWAQDGLPGRDTALLADIEQLGRITGEMHLALGSRPDLPDFAPEPVSAADVEAWLADLRSQQSTALASAQTVRQHLPADVQRLLARVILSEAKDLPSWLQPERFFVAALLRLTSPDFTKIQIHGDYHLGQVLKTPEGFSIIDFEGEPARPLEERRAKQPPLRDVAGMLRSLHYAAHSVSSDERWAEAWARSAGLRFVQGWLAGSERRFVPDSDEATKRLLVLFQLAKAYYELSYELNNRPDWAAVPLRGIASLLAEVRA